MITCTPAGIGRIISGIRWAVVLLALACGAPALADSGRDSNTPTGWYVYVDQTAASVTSTINSGARLVSLKVANPATPTFDTTYVSNSGEYQQTFWWYYNATAANVASLLASNNARLISIESYDAGGGARRFAVVMVSNAGVNNKTWYWYSASSIATISAAASANNARVVYLSSDAIGGSRVYNAILIANTGADASGWYWYVGYNATSLNTLIGSGQRILSLEMVDPTVPTFNVVTETSRGQRWWWFYGFASGSDALSTALQYGARIYDIQRYTTAAGTRYAALMLDNSDPITSRIGDILRTSDGVSGCYLKQVNGPVIAGLQQDYVFEPASCIKALHHLHSLLRVQAGALSLATTHTVYSGYSGSCPQDTGAFTESFSTTLNAMMMNSDNARTQSVRTYFGQAALNATAASLGMSNTLLQHRLGCGGDPVGDFGAISHPNHLTLTDIGIVYEQVATGILNPTNKAQFYNLMDHSLHADVNTILTAEAASQGVSGATLTTFRNNVSECYKGGNYGLSSGGPSWYDQTRAGWIKIPHRTPGCTTTYYEYVYGTFVNNASNDAAASNAAGTAFAELTREQLRAGLATYRCLADFNASGGLDVQDIFDFLNAWLAGQACADFSGGGLSVQDIFDFLNAWLAGC